MKTTVTDRYRYIALYLLFSLLLCSLLSLMLIVGYKTNEKDRSKSADAEPKGDVLPVVVIDAGHGGEDGGTVGQNGAYEKDINLSIALMLSDMLRANGIETVLTRSDDILLYDKNSNYHGQKKIQDLATRRKIAESYENAVFVSIHMNSFPEEKYSGLQVYYSKNDESSKFLAESIQSLTKEKLLPDNTRKCKAADSNIYLLDRLSCPAILVECGFLSNPQECARLSDSTYQKQLALCLCKALTEYVAK
ncbi:MAG: N-acetylmuramoyl-L-alanine amidase [Clostridia bacterium]|nr:N-acetylmuramoyl-L-alanine amidase [Clostridia bacterium]